MSIDLVFLDLDEVLVDFVSAACEAHGLTREEFEEKRIPGVWDMTTTLNISQNEFWAAINDRGVGFWANLKPLPWMKDLIDLVEWYVGEENWFILSAPNLSVQAFTGKVMWLKYTFGHDFERFFISPHKELLAAPGRLLIDDRQRNIDSFESAGGDSILFPHQGNRLYGLMGNVEEMLGTVERKLNARK